MNICIILISDGWGGAEKVVHDLAKQFKENGDNVYLIINQEIITFYESLGVEILNIGNMYKSFNKKNKNRFPVFFHTDKYHLISYYINEFVRPLKFLILRNKLRRYLHKNNIKVIHSHLENSHILGYIIKSPDIHWVITLHGVGMSISKLFTEFKFNIKNVYWLIKNKILIKCIKRSDKITVVSRYVLQKLETKIPNISEKITIIRNGIFLDDFKRENIGKFDLSGEFKLLFPHGAKYHKGGDIIIKAINVLKKEIQGIHLYIAQDVPNMHRLRSMVQEMELQNNVTFTGFLVKDEFIKLMNSVDVMIEMYREESFGIVCLEAMALGIPIIAGNVWLPDFVKNEEYGLFVKPNVENASEAIKKMYYDKELRSTIKKNSLRDIIKFDWPNKIDDYYKVYTNT